MWVYLPVKWTQIKWISIQYSQLIDPMDGKNSVLTTMFIPELGLPSIKLENKKMSS